MLAGVATLVLGSLAVLPLLADDSSKLPSLQAGSGTPTRGESGWINLPHLRGLQRLDRLEGESLFRDIKSLHDHLGILRSDPTAGAAFVVEGWDAYLAPCMVVRGIPEVSIASLGDWGWQAVLSGAFLARMESGMIRPASNDIGVVFPRQMVGAVVKVTGEGLGEDEDLYFLLDSEQLLLSWQAIVNLAGTGVSPVRIEGVSLEGDHFRMALRCLPGDTCLEVLFGADDF